MNGTGVKKERGEEREAVQTHCSRRNQSKLGYDFVESRKSKYARGDDRGAKYPCCPGPSRLRHGIEFNRHSKECSDFFPPFVRWTTVEIGAARLLRELLYFGHRNRLARLLRQLGRWRRHGTRRQIFHFGRVEPDEVAEATNVYFDLGVV